MAKGDEPYWGGPGHGAAPKSGERPRAGQSKPYTSGANARGKHERPTQGPAPGERSGTAPASGPFKGGFKGQ